MYRSAAWAFFQTIGDYARFCPDARQQRRARRRPVCWDERQSNLMMMNHSDRAGEADDGRRRLRRIRHWRRSENRSGKSPDVPAAKGSTAGTVAASTRFRVDRKEITGVPPVHCNGIALRHGDFEPV